MRDKISKLNSNNISGNIFNGPTNIVMGNNDKFKENEMEKGVKYTTESVWRSPITMAILSWVGFFISLIGIFPLYKIFEPIISLFSSENIKINQYNNVYLVIFFVTILLLMLIIWLRSITKKQIRNPLLFNYAINGFGKKLTLEKVNIDTCPQCGGKMKYFSKPIEFFLSCDSDGNIKRHITKRVPALQCKRNSDHWYEVDPTDNLNMYKSDEINMYN